MTRTGHEPWKDPYAYGFDRSGKQLRQLWNPDPTHQAGAQFGGTGLMADTTGRSVGNGPDGTLLLGLFADGGNTVAMRDPHDEHAPLDPGVLAGVHQATPGYGFKGASSTSVVFRANAETGVLEKGTFMSAWISPARANGLAISGAVRQAMAPFLQPPLVGLTWIDLNKQLFDAIAMERNVMFFLLLFIIIVAAFGIMNTLITVTVQKTREIGIMKALGASTGQIIWVFLAQGMVVGFFGNITGLALGMTLVRYRNEFKDWLARALHVEIFPADVYQFSTIPAEVVPHDVAIICLSAFAICSLAALIPAYSAARLDPVKALRYE